jgi:NAD(P)-dependent dehydrogenase (short-subunit alcohol dehydrogenase family)
MIDIHNQVAVVTGAGRGIGRAIAIELARAGAHVALAARSRQELEETAKAVGVNASVFPTDVRDKNQVHSLFDQTASALGPIDILVNSAGVGIFGPVVNFTDEDFSTLIDTNLRGTFYTCRYVLPSMIERKTGHIINIASIAGKVGSANRAVYCASKFGVVGFTESVAEEVRQYGIRASVICPGSTDTAFSGGTAAALRDGPSSQGGGKARNKMLRPEDIAYTVRMLVMQDPNSFISEIILRPTQKP